MAIDLPAPFTDGRLVLRPPTEADVPALVEACNDPALVHFVPVPAPYDDDAGRAFVESSAAGLIEGSEANLVVEVDGAVAGTVGLVLLAADRVGRVGYWVAPDARGHGVATDATRLLCRFALDPAGLDLVRLELVAAATNPASNAVARRLGFTHEGTRRSAMLLRAAGGFPEERADANDWGLLRGELR